MLRNSLIVSLSFLIGVAACGGGSGQVKRCRSPRSMGYILTVSDRVNPDDEGRSLPTVVRMYQLRGLQKLENAEFEEIWQNATETLGDDLVKFDEFTVFPADRVANPLEIADGVSYVIAVALVRKPAGTSWRAVYELPLEKCENGRAEHQVTARFELANYRIEALDLPREDAP
jgi:type VI secretion system protein VasD